MEGKMERRLSMDASELRFILHSVDSANTLPIGD